MSHMNLSKRSTLRISTVGHSSTARQESWHIMALLEDDDANSLGQKSSFARLSIACADDLAVHAATAVGSPIA